MKPPRDTDHAKAPAKPKRSWSKPTIRKMSYVNVVASGPHVLPHTDDEYPKYRPSSS